MRVDKALDEIFPALKWRFNILFLLIDRNISTKTVYKDNKFYDQPFSLICRRRVSFWIVIFRPLISIIFSS